MAGFGFDDRPPEHAPGDPEVIRTAAACLDLAANLMADFERLVGAQRVTAAGGDPVSTHAEKAIQAAVQNQLVAAMNGARRLRGLSAGLRKTVVF